MDILMIAVCMSIGSAVAWVIALYTTRGVQRLLWDFPFATLGAVLCASVVNWFSPRLVIVALLTAGPLCAVLMLFVGDAIRRAACVRLGRRS
jgi:hypothetical protein